MNIKRNTKNTINEELQESKHWKSNSKGYLEEIENFLEKIKAIEEKGLRRDILMTMLRADNELTKLSEELFEVYYQKGYEDGEKDNSRDVYRNN